MIFTAYLKSPSRAKMFLPTTTGIWSAGWIRHVATARINGTTTRSPMFKSLVPERCGSKFKSIFAPALPELLWLPTVWRCPYIEIAFSTLDCSIVPTCGAWCSATAAKRGPLKQSWAEIQHSRDDEPLGVLMQMRNVRVNGFFFFSSLGVLPGVLVDTLSLCSGDFCVVEGDIDMQ